MKIFSAIFLVFLFIPTLVIGMQNKNDELEENSPKITSLKKRNLNNHTQTSESKSSPNGRSVRSQEEDKENVSLASNIPHPSEQDTKETKKRKVEIFKNKQEENQEAKLSVDIEPISMQISLGRKDADKREIYKAYLAFIEINSNEETWEALAKSMNAYRWPSQKSWKQVVGGHLFFPKETLDWEMTLCEDYRLRRIDSLWSFAFGAKFQHAMSKFYLVRMLDKLRSDYTDADRPAFFERLYKEAFKDLSQCEENPDACYIIGRNYFSFPYLSSSYFSDKDGTYEALKWHAKGKDLKNQYQILHIKECSSALYDPPALEEYLSLAQQGHNPAYGTASDLTKTYDEEEKILKQAIDKGHKPALLWLGCLYQNRGKREEAKETYIKAGEAGITRAYVTLGLMYVGDVKYKQESIKKLKERSPDDIKEAIQWFTKAGEVKNQEGWSYLGTLYHELFKQKLISEEEYYEKSGDAVLKGMSLGSTECYMMAYSRFTKESFQECMKVHGYPPHADLRYIIEKFINNKP